MQGGTQNRQRIDLGGVAPEKRVLPHFTGEETKAQWKDLPKISQPGLVTPEDTLVSPGVSPSEPPAERDQLAHSSILEDGRARELHRRGGHSPMHPPKPPSKWYAGHTCLPSAPVSQKSPRPPNPSLALSSREVMHTWGLSLLGAPTWPLSLGRELEPRPHLCPTFVRGLSSSWQSEYPAELKTALNQCPSESRGWKGWRWTITPLGQVEEGG